MVRYTIKGLRKAILDLFASSSTHRHIVNTLGRPSQPGDLERFLGVTFDEEERNRARLAFERLRSDDRLRPTLTDTVAPMDWYAITESGRAERQGLGSWASDEPPPPDETEDMTGLFRRASFDRDVEEALEHSRAVNLPMSLLIFDLDDFKSINDTHGHSQGDAAIRCVADCLRRIVFRGRAYRIGGDEFAAILVDVPDAEARAVGEKVRGCVSAAGSGAYQLSVTVGACSSGSLGSDAVAKTLFDRADEELLDTKKARKGERVSLTAIPGDGMTLYTKRFTVYAAARTLIAAAVANADVRNEEGHSFLRETKEADFLFGPEVTKYLLQLSQKANELHSLAFRLAGNELPVGPLRSEIAERESVVLEWFVIQPGEAIRIFKPYLDLSGKQA